MRRSTSLIFIIINVFLSYTTYQTLRVNYKLRYEVSVKYKKVETFVEIDNLTSSAFIEFQCEQSRPTDWLKTNKLKWKILINFPATASCHTDLLRTYIHELSLIIWLAMDDAHKSQYSDSSSRATTLCWFKLNSETVIIWMTKKWLPVLGHPCAAVHLFIKAIILLSLALQLWWSAATDMYFFYFFIIECKLELGWSRQPKSAPLMLYCLAINS